MSFETLWRQYHPTAQPLGWILRDVEESNWVRFHSLPESKRYPDDDAEKATILLRQNILADEVLGAEASSWLVCCRAVGGGPERHMRPYRSLIARYNMTKVWSFTADADLRFSAYAARVTWRAGTFDDVLLQIADDEVSALWVSETTGAVFAPYDGGIDCILASPAEMQGMKAQHRAWLSQYPGGL
jgi:hypothetical protein